MSGAARSRRDIGPRRGGDRRRRDRRGRRGRRRRSGDDAGRPRLRLRPHLRGRDARRSRSGAHDIVVNLQGDLPTLEPQLVARLRSRRCRSRRVDIATLAAEITRRGGAHQPRTSSRSSARRCRRRAACARSISRAPPRPPATARSTTTSASTPTGARRCTLRALPPSPLELREKLEQLRALEAGMRIDVTVVDTVPLGVDTPADLERARRLLGGALALLLDESFEALLRRLVVWVDLQGAPVVGCGARLIPFGLIDAAAAHVGRACPRIVLDRLRSRRWRRRHPPRRRAPYRANTRMTGRSDRCASLRRSRQRNS